MRKSSFIAVASIIVCSQASQAAIILTTTGVYDETGNTNAVDSTAPGSSSTLAAFKISVSTAYASNQGGVITFDNIVMPVPPASLSDSSLSVSYGVSASQILTITHNATSGDFQFQANSAVGTAISGSSYIRNLGFMGSGSQNYIFSTSLSQLGFTILSRTGQRTVSAMVTYDNGSTATLTDTMANGAGVDDTFFHFAAGASPIKSLSLVATPNTDFFALDDIGFIVIPEPSCALLGAAGFAGLLVLRRRNA